MENFYDSLRDLIYQSLLKEIKEGEKILDVGCGDCDIDFYFARRRRLLRILGIDIGISDRKEKVKDSYVECRKGDASIFMKIDEFDVVISKYSLHEFSKPRVVLENCHKVLKEGGKIIVVDFPKGSLAEKLWGEEYFSLQEVREMLEQAKFKRVKGRLLTKEGPFVVTGVKGGTDS